MLPLLLLVGGGVLLFAAVASASTGSGNDIQPDYTPVPGSGKTGYKKVDAILGDLRQAAASSKIPLGVLVGWIAKESGGSIKSTTKYGEKGYFQLMPSEAESLGLDINKLAADSDYSINSGLLLIAKHMRDTRALGVAAEGSTYFWRLVKLCHTMGTGATKIIVNGAREAGAAGSWETLVKHALDNEKDYLHKTKHSPSKWFPLVDKVYAVGAPFGFGTEQQSIVGEAFWDEILDPLDLL